MLTDATALYICPAVVCSVLKEFPFVNNQRVSSRHDSPMWLTHDVSGTNLPSEHTANGLKKIYWSLYKIIIHIRKCIVDCLESCFFWDNQNFSPVISWTAWLNIYLTAWHLHYQTNTVKCNKAYIQENTHTSTM